MTPHQLQTRDFPLLSVHLAQTRNASERNARNASHLQEVQENPLDSTLNASRELPAVFLAPCLHPACSVKDKELNKCTRTCIKCIITASSPSNSSSLLLNTSPRTCLSGGILRACNLQHRLKVEPNCPQAAVTKLSPTERHCLCQAGLCVLSWTFSEMAS